MIPICVEGVLIARLPIRLINTPYEVLSETIVEKEMANKKIYKNSPVFLINNAIDIDR